MSDLHDSTRWRVLGASFVSYGFDAMDFMILALSLALITQELGLTLAEAGLLGTAGMLGVGLSSVVVGWYSDNYGAGKHSSIASLPLPSSP